MATLTPAAPAPAPRALLGSRVPQLDGVRGLAISLVLLSHCGAHEMHTTRHSFLDAVHVALTWGWSGVDLFFVLSGFLIGGILIENRESPNFFKTFYIRRVCRIFPLYYAWLGVTMLLPLLPFSSYVRHLFMPDVPFWSYFSYTQNVVSVHFGDFGPEWFGPTWSLAVEEQFYLLFPLLIRFCPPRYLPYWLGLLAGSGVLLRVAAYFLLPAPGYAGFVLLPCRWDSLLLGALSAWLVRRPGFVEALRRHQWFLFWLAALILGTLVALRIGHQGDLQSLGMHLLGLSLLAILSCEVLFVALYSTRSWIQAFFTNRALRGLGTISYCVYLIHQPVVFLCHGLVWEKPPQMASAPQFLTTLCALAITVGVATLSWRFFESKCQSWGRTFAY